MKRDLRRCWQPAQALASVSTRGTRASGLCSVKSTDFVMVSRRPIVDSVPLGGGQRWMDALTRYVDSDVFTRDRIHRRTDVATLEVAHGHSRELSAMHGSAH